MLHSTSSVLGRLELRLRRQASGHRLRVMAASSALFGAARLLYAPLLALLLCAVHPGLGFPGQLIQRAGEADPSQFVRREGSSLLLHGQPFFIAGWNSYHLLDCTHLQHDRKWLEKHGCPATDEVLQKGTALGLNVLRTWGFHDGKQKHKYPLQTSPGHYDEKTFRLLDYTIARAKAYNVKVILPLVDFVGAYGGALQYLKWANNNRRKYKIEEREEFFRNKMCKKLFKQHLQHLLLRRNAFNNITYRDDPTILAWEIANEPRAPFDTDGNALQSWIEEMSQYVKKLDPHHLVAIGSEGWFGKTMPQYQSLNPPTVTKYPIDWNATEGSDWIRNHNLDSVDIATFRLWNHWLPDSTSETQQKRFWRQWINGHLEAGAKHLKKPVVLEEFGLRHVPTRTRDKFMKLAYRQVEASISRGGAAAGTCFWMLADDGYPDWDGFTVYSPAHASTAIVIREHAAALRGHKSRVAAVTPSLSAPENLSADEKDEDPESVKSSWILELLLAGFLFLIPLLLSALCFILLWVALSSANKRRHL